MDLSFLRSVSKPTRYTGGEVNEVVKSGSREFLHAALAFPDSYEIGMSYLGLKILYGALNSRDDIWAERVFMPMPDMEAEITRRGIPLYALESKRPLFEFDIIGFSLAFELCYTNILHMLRMGRVPLRSAERGPGHPLVIAGGPCACNPEPLADFIDAFFIGEAEEGFAEICHIVRSSHGGDRHQLLEDLAKIEGVYVPSLYATGEDPVSGMRVITGPAKPEYPFPVKRRIIRDLDRFPFPEKCIVPHHEVVHDRYSIEIARGCNEGCRFCQAGYIYRPYRERSAAGIIGSVSGGIKATGYNEVTLLSLNSGGYEGVSELARAISSEGAGQRVAVSMPSLKVSTLTQELADSTSTARKSGFTIAPEAGTQRLRDSINKSVTEEDLLKAVHIVFSSGWNLLKLYFIIGLPGERDEDIRGIIDLAARVSRAARAARGGSLTINLSTSSFVPKPFTPFQWEPMERTERLLSKQSDLKAGLRRPISYKWHPAGASQVEALFSLGDRRLCATLEEAARLGCRLDAWTEHFNYDLWQKAMNSTGVSLDSYLYREREMGEFLPWDVIDMGVTKRFLWGERVKSAAGEKTEACGPENCTGCGSPIRSICTSLSPREITCLPEGMLPNAVQTASRAGKGAIPKGSSPLAPDHFKARVEYRKVGLSRFLGHLDLIDVFVRALRRASVKLAYSSGFHPMPKIELAAPLPLGVEGRVELLDISLLEQADCNFLLAALDGNLPAGVEVARVWIPRPGEPKLAALEVQSYQIDLSGLDGEGRQEFEKAIARFMASQSVAVTKMAKGRSKKVELKERVLSLDLVGDKVLVKMVKGGFMDLLGVLAPPQSLERLGLARLAIGPMPATAAAEHIAGGAG